MISLSIHHWLAIAPLLFVVAGGLALMLVDAFSKSSKSWVEVVGGAGAVQVRAADPNQSRDQGELAMLSALILFASAALAAGVWYSGLYAGAPETASRFLVVDQLGLFFDIVICVGTGLAVLLAGGYLPEHELDRGEFYPLILFSAFGAMVLARAADLLTVFVGLETLSLGVYCLVAFRRTSSRSVEGALKYFLLGSFAAAILLFGSALLYGGTGQTNLAAIGKAVSAGHADMRLVILGMLMVIVGLAFKIGAVPFHMWTPDAYEGAITPATTFMAIAVKAAAFAVLVRVVLVSFGDSVSSDGSTGWPPLLAMLAALSMILGNLAAVVQKSVKRMLAYSSIAHAGYLLVGLAAAFKVGQEAVTAVLYYLAAYTVSSVLAFGALIAFGSRGKEAVSYEDLAYAGRRHPMAALAFVLGVLTLMGFPPTGGFFAKYYVFNAAVQAGGMMIWLAVLGMITSAIGAFYYLRVLVYLFMKQPEPGAATAVPMRSGYVAVALGIAAILVLLLGLAPSHFLGVVSTAASHLKP